jgi:hypothetical protein
MSHRQSQCSEPAYIVSALGSQSDRRSRFPTSLHYPCNSPVHFEGVAKDFKSRLRCVSQSGGRLHSVAAMRTAIRNRRSRFQHPFALSLAIVPATNANDKADCKTIFSNRRWRLRIANVRNLPCIRQVMIQRQHDRRHCSNVLFRMRRQSWTLQLNCRKHSRQITYQDNSCGRHGRRELWGGSGAESRADFVHKLRIVLRN